MVQPGVWRRRGLVAFAVVYAATSVGYLVANLLEVTPAGVIAYMFTWDMFPHFHSWSVRRVAIGRTRGGRCLVLHPSDHAQFRAGVEGDLTRSDLERGGSSFRAVVEGVRRATRGERRDDPLTSVVLLEQAWPVKYNFDEASHRRWMGDPKPERWSGPGMTDAVFAPPEGVPRAHWRVLEEYPVDEESPTDDEPGGGSAP